MQNFARHFRWASLKKGVVSFDVNTARSSVGKKSVPMRRRIEFDLNCFLVLFYVVPLAVRVQALGNHLNQDFPLRNVWNFHCSVLIGL